MKKTLSKIAMGLFIVAALAINVIPLLAKVTNSGGESPETPGYYLCVEHYPCVKPGYLWAHCITCGGCTCDVSAQHDCEPPEEPIGLN